MYFTLLPKTCTTPMQIQVQNSEVIVRTYAWNNERWLHGIVRTCAWNNERWRHGIVRTYAWNNESCRQGHMGHCTCCLASTKKSLSMSHKQQSLHFLCASAIVPSLLRGMARQCIPLQTPFHCQGFRHCNLLTTPNRSNMLRHLVSYHTQCKWFLGL
jgi:hypothetical protein